MSYYKDMDIEYIKAISKKIIHKKSSPDSLSGAFAEYYDYNKQLKLIRKAMGYTQKQLSDKVGVSVKTITRIEKGEVAPSLSTLSKIASALKSELKIILLPEKPIADIVDEIIETEAIRIVNMSLGNAALESQTPNNEAIKGSIQKVKAMLYKKRNISWEN